MHASIDSPIDGADVAHGQLRIVGWVFDRAGPLDAALVVVGDAPPQRPRLGLWRPDVGEAFPEVAHAGASGFICDVELRDADSGPTPVSILVQTGSSTWVEAVSIEVCLNSPPAEEQGLRPRAAFTIAQNEPMRLPLWLDYYGRYFDRDDLYVLDHDSTDRTTQGLETRCRVVPIHRTASFDHRWLRSTVEAFQAFLLRSYETVLFAEVDEFIVADPRRYCGLDDYIARLERPAARCLGFNVVHQPDEPAMRFGEPMLAQRRYWHASLQYCKRLISRVPLRWSEGFHDEYNAPDDPPDESLLLVHLHRIDYDSCLERHRETASRDWSTEDVIRGDGGQNRIAAPGEFEQWFRNGPDLDSPRELIPDHVRAVL